MSMSNVSLAISKVELGNCQQLAGKRAKEIEAASEVEAELFHMDKAFDALDLQRRFCVLAA